VSCAGPLLLCIVFTELQLRYWRNSEKLFEHALIVTRNNFSAHFSLGNALVEKGKMKEGIVHLKEASRLAPNLAEVHGKIGLVLANEGKIREAINSYRTALSLKPDLPEALNNLSWILATTPDPQIRDGVQAVLLAERACELTHNEQPIMLGTLAAAYAEAGRFSDAIETAKKAESLALSLGQWQLAEMNRKLIELYQSGKPFRDLQLTN
jgi:protein O-mannosyl-transferase